MHLKKSYNSWKDAFSIERSHWYSQCFFIFGLPVLYQKWSDLIGHPQHRYRKKIEDEYRVPWYATWTADSFARWLRIAEVPLSLLQYIPKLRFPTFYVTLCIDATCGFWRALTRAHIRGQSIESDSHLTCMPCARQKWLISTDRCYSR